MPLRELMDAGGTRWRIWNVHPTQRPSPRLAGDERELRAGPARDGDEGAEERSRLSATPGLEQGWLCFESPAEKRRLTPIPEGWEAMPDAELERYLERAEPVRVRHTGERRAVVLTDREVPLPEA